MMNNNKKKEVTAVVHDMSLQYDRVRVLCLLIVSDIS